MEAIEIGKGINIGLADLVNGVSRLETPELKKVLDELNQVLARRNKHKSEDLETQLLLKIKGVMPPAIVRRFKQLNVRTEANPLSEKEEEELLLLADFLEERSAERVLLMGELAKIQQISLPELAKKLRLRDLYE